MNIKCIICGPVNVNTYVLYSDLSKESLIIDPGDYLPIKEFLKEQNLGCSKVILTHGHFDHICGLKALCDTYSPQVYIHEKDENMLYSSYDNGADLFRYSMNLPNSIKPTLLKDGSEIISDDFKFKVLHTPGHTTGSICLLNDDENVMFSGDTIFRYSYGRTDLPFADESAMIKSLKMVYSLKQDYLIYTGHGPKTSIAKERAYHGY